MKTTINPFPFCGRNPGRRAWLAAGLLISAAIFAQNTRANDILWTGGAGTGTLWTNLTSWSGGVVPGSADNAFFNGTFTGSPITVNNNPATAVQVGSITLGTGASMGPIIKCQSTGPTLTTLNLNGVGGILLSNGSASYLMTFVGTNTVNNNVFNLGFGTSGNIYANTLTPVGQPPADGGAGEIAINCTITGPGSITNMGPGILFFNGATNANLYTGSTTLSAGTLELGPAATAGDGTGPLIFAGGNLESGGNSSTRLIANPIVVNTTGKAYIYNHAGSAGTRVFVFSGGLSGTSGTLTLVNLDTTAGEFFDVEMRGTFTFNLPLIVGDYGVPYWSENYPSDYTELQLANSIATGPQTFNGNISGDGPIIRGSLTNVVVSGANGTTIFTGNNTYSGGTTINNGSLFANNTTGSALGSGPVMVTNNAILSGNGFIAGPVSVYMNGNILPGSATNTVGTLTTSGGLTFYPQANYTWQMASATGTAGTAWDLIDASGSGWTDAGSTPVITINVTSQGVPAGWNSTLSYSWMIITNNGGGTGYTASHWMPVTTGFGGPIAGVFGTTNDANGDLILTYTPTSGTIVINVTSGSVSQSAVSPTPYPLLSGGNSVTKVGNGEVVMDNPANSYLGQTIIDAGTASAAVDSTTAGGAFGASSLALSLGNTTGASSNATLNIDVNNVTVQNGVIVQAGNAGVKTIGTTASGATYSGNVTLNDSVKLSAVAASSESFAGTFSGAGGITFADSGTITLAGAGSYAGPTTFSGGGSLNLNASAIGTNTFTIGALGALDNTSGSSVTLGNNPPQIWNTDINFTGSSSLNLGTGPVTMSANRTLTVGANTLTVGGTIGGTGFGLTKAGTGELLLTASTNSSYTGGTTNQAGILAVNATATFGDGTGPLVLAGGDLLDTGTRAGSPIANPVKLIANTRVYGNSTDTASPNRYLPFTGVFTVTGGSTLYIDNIGAAKTIFNLSLQGTNYTIVNWPIVIGDMVFDINQGLAVLNLINDNTTPVETFSGLISGPGSVIRGANTLNTGGTTIFTQQNTFAGGVALNSGALGFGASSVTNISGMVSGPVGTGQITIGASNNETNLTVFASGGAVQIDNKLFFNGNTNITFGGTNNMLFTSAINSGNAAKTVNVTTGIVTTFAGPVTNTGTSGGGPLTKAGGGTLVLSAVNTYAGSTTVSGGKLLVTGALGTNVVTVNSAGTLGGTGILGGNLTFSGSGGQAYLYKSAGLPDSPLTVAGNVVFNGNTVVVDLGGTTTLGLGTNTLINYSGTLSGVLSTVPTLVNGSLAAGKGATIDLTTPNQVNLVVGVASTTPPNFTAGGVRLLPSGNISLMSTGAVGTAYHLWATTNLMQKPVTAWTLVQSGTVTTSPFTINDLTATNFPQRFYLFSTP